MGLLDLKPLEPARALLGSSETIDVVADRGYFKSEDIEACEKAGCVPHVLAKQAAARLLGARGPCSARTSSCNTDAERRRSTSARPGSC